ncbi:hypothetical protein V3C99_015180 [Haemonchus contortus]
MSNSKCVGDLPTCDNVCLLKGGFNYPDIDWNVNPPQATGCASSSIEMISSYPYSQLVTSSTRGQHILALLFCNNPDATSKTTVAALVGNSDYASVHSTIRSPINRASFVLK